MGRQHSTAPTCDFGLGLARSRLFRCIIIPFIACIAGFLLSSFRFLLLFLSILSLVRRLLLVFGFSLGILILIVKQSSKRARGCAKFGLLGLALLGLGLLRFDCGLRFGLARRGLARLGFVLTSKA